jgi:hypothetical protein
MMPTTVTRVRLWISHKPKDARAARQIADALQVIGRERLSVLVMEDSPEGMEFLTRCRELAQADTLLLLYTDPHQDCNLCVYESGFFYGKYFPDSTRRLIILHDEDVTIPHPLNHFSSVVVSDTNRVELQRFVEDLFAKPVREGIDPVFPEIMNERWKQVRTSLEQTIIDAVSGQQQTRSFMREITIDVPRASLKATMDANTNNMPADAQVFADHDSFELLGLNENPRGYPWPVFYEAIDRASDNTQEWTDSLVNLMVTIAFTPKLLSSTGLPLYRCTNPKNGTYYRPAVRSFRRKRDTLSFSIVFVDLPSEATTEEKGAATTLAQALTLGRMFRWGVLCPFRDRLASLESDIRIGLDTTATAKRLAEDASRFLENTLTAYVEGRNRGYRRGDLLRCFLDQNGARVQLQALLDQWDHALEQFKELLNNFKHGDTNVGLARELVSEVIDINRQFMIICAQRYKEMLEEW